MEYYNNPENTGKPAGIYTYQTPPKETEEQREKRAEIFGKLAVPTLVYAVIYTFLLYNNLGSIAMPFFVLLTTCYVNIVMKRLGIMKKAGNTWYILGMFLLGISDSLTGNEGLVFYNNILLFALLVLMLLHNFTEDEKWGFGSYFKASFQAVFGAIGTIGDLTTESICFFRKSKNLKTKRWAYILLGIGIAIPFLAVVITLLCFADAVFAQLIKEGFRLNIDFGTIVGVGFTFLFGFLTAYCGIRYLGKNRISEEAKDHRNWEPVVAITTLIMISVVYLCFSGVQIVYLFAGKGVLPQGYTYSFYARKGFFELLAVCVINLILVLFIQAFFRENRILKALLAVISGYTYVMMASSAYRMILYIENYNLTVLRILVLWALAVLAVFFAGVLLHIFKNNFSLFRYGLAIVCVGYLILSFARPDYLIASYNLNQTCNENVDYSYLENLSVDAAPVIVKKEGAWVDRYREYHSGHVKNSIRRFNFAENLAERLLEES